MDSRDRLRPDTRNRPRYTPARVLGVFCAAYAAVVIMAVLQDRNREGLETTEAPTGVGDTAYFELPAVVWARPIAILERGDPPFRWLYLQNETPEVRSDAAMRKVAWPGKKYFVYRDPNEDRRLERYYLKVDRDRYLPVGPKPRRKPQEPPE